ncbi:MAG: tripartite tricarboxylate transporter TctB family protein [Candidatus Parcubacteria bacterium]|nr:tripartite tricarboxylate transporter TctB family protein [Burkholderiales bacterium]
MRRNAAEIALSLGLLALGLGVVGVTATLSSEGGYSGIGPNFIPGVVGAGIIVLGLWLSVEAFTGGWRGAAPDDAHERGEHDFNGAAFGWITAGLFAHMALIGWSGFVLSGMVLFACIARAFGSLRIARDLAAGLALSLVVFLFFVKLLNVNLPAGWLSPILGTAGI